jgi:hypothetical protein
MAFIVSNITFGMSFFAVSSEKTRLSGIKKIKLSCCRLIIRSIYNISILVFQVNRYVSKILFFKKVSRVLTVQVNRGHSGCQRYLFVKKQVVSIPFYVCSFSLRYLRQRQACRTFVCQRPLAFSI